MSKFREVAGEVYLGKISSSCCFPIVLGPAGVVPRAFIRDSRIWLFVEDVDIAFLGYSAKSKYLSTVTTSSKGYVELLSDGIYEKKHTITLDALDSLARSRRGEHGHSYRSWRSSNETLDFESLVEPSNEPIYGETCIFRSKWGTFHFVPSKETGELLFYERDLLCHLTGGESSELCISQYTTVDNSIVAVMRDKILLEVLRNCLDDERRDLLLPFTSWITWRILMYKREFMPESCNDIHFFEDVKISGEFEYGGYSLDVYECDGKYCLSYVDVCQWLDINPGDFFLKNELKGHWCIKVSDKVINYDLVRFHDVYLTGEGVVALLGLDHESEDFQYFSTKYHYNDNFVGVTTRTEANEECDHFRNLLADLSVLKFEDKPEAIVAEERKTQSHYDSMLEECDVEESVEEVYTSEVKTFVQHKGEDLIVVSRVALLQAMTDFRNNPNELVKIIANAPSYCK